jgi:hypothetical protein
MKTNTIFHHILPSSLYIEKCCRQKLSKKSKHNYMRNNFFNENLTVFDNVKKYFSA